VELVMSPRFAGSTVRYVLAGIFLLIALSFVYRSFFGMRITESKPTPPIAPGGTGVKEYETVAK
jgi:hypothetical protein